MSERWIQLARRIQDQPWNRPGADKTWVLRAMAEQWAFREVVRQARRVAPR